MKKGTTILALVILSLFLVSIIAGVISAQEQTNILKEAGNFFSSNSGIFNEVSKASFSKFLLVVLLILIIYSAADMIPFLSTATEGLKWAVSIIIGILGFIFVSPENVAFILTNYEAMGIAITTIIPLLVIFGFTVKLQKDHPTTAAFINPFVLILFSLYCFTKWITIYWQPGNVPELAYLYPISLILTVIWLFTEKYIARWLTKQEIIAKTEEAENLTTKATKGAGVLANTLDKMAAEAEQLKKNKGARAK